MNRFRNKKEVVGLSLPFQVSVSLFSDTARQDPRDLESIL